MSPIMLICVTSACLSHNRRGYPSGKGVLGWRSPHPADNLFQPSFFSFFLSFPEVLQHRVQLLRSLRNQAAKGQSSRLRCVRGALMQLLYFRTIC